MINKPWWENTDIAHSAALRGSISQIASHSLLSLALKEDKCVYEYSRDGNILTSQAEFIAEIRKLNGRIVWETVDNVKEKIADPVEYIFAWKDAVLTVSLDDVDWIYTKISSLNQGLVLAFKEVVQKHIYEKKKDRVYTIVSGEGGPELKQLSGKAGMELERRNYTDEANAAFDKIIKDLKSEEPSGRLVVLSGIPGGGKTFFIRGITNAIDNATFILVPPAMISDIMGPQFISVLIDYYEKGHPLVFIIEDADSCLVERAADNMTSISSLLNLGDGIFGKMFSVYVLATTNSAFMEIDKALVRPGRLSAHVNFDKLTAEHANKVYCRLVGNTDKNPFTKSASLAEVYQAARHN